VADVFGQLGDLLAAANARLSIAPKVPTRSTIYDLDYRISIIACAMQALSTKGDAGSRQVSASWLKLAQFTAMRPGLCRISSNGWTNVNSQLWRRSDCGAASSATAPTMPSSISCALKGRCAGPATS